MPVRISGPLVSNMIAHVLSGRCFRASLRFETHWPWVYENTKHQWRQSVTYLVVAVGEIEASNVHSGVEHFDEHFDVPAGRSEGADNLGLAFAEVDLFKDVLEFDAT